MSTATLLMVFSIAPLACGCNNNEPGDLPPLEWHGERVSFGTDLVDEVCRGTITMLDRGIAEIETALELPAADQRISVWALSDESLFGQCEVEVAAGCATRSRAFLGRSFHCSYLHELVHARALQIVGYGKPIFGEGLAEAIGGHEGSCLGTKECADAELESFLVQANPVALGIGGYVAGGDLVHGMLSQYGPTDVLAFLAQITGDTPSSEVRSSYLARFGSILDEDYQAFRRSPLDEFTPMQVNCNAPAAPRTGPEGGVVFQATMDCSSPQVINNFYPAAKGGDSRQALVEWTFAVPPEQAGAFALTGAMADGSYLAIRRCVPNDFRGVASG